MKCPYCSSTNTRVFLEMEMPNFLTAYDKKNEHLVKTFPFEASLCLDCLLGFNSKPLPKEELDLIYDNYKYINPNKGIGFSKYQRIKQLLTKFLNHDDYIVDIGCSDGVLLSYLYDRGYRNLEGIDPSPVPLGADYKIKMRKEYFGEDTRFERLVDSFLLVHVWKHFTTPLKILEIMKSKLSAKGRIIIEVPNFSGFYHHHLLYYNKYFIHQLTENTDISMEFLEEDSDVIRLVLKFGERKPFLGFTEEEKGAFCKGVFDIANKSKTSKESFISFLEEKRSQQIIWWGSGSASIIALNQIPNELLQSLDIAIVDSDITRKGLFVPGFKKEIRYSDEELKNKHIEVLVIASSFRKEILEKVKSLGCSVGSEYLIEYV